MAQEKPRDYTQRFKQNGQRPGQNNGNNQQKKRRSAPDATVHHPPGFLFLLGGLGTTSGVVTNFWQGFTTFSAMWDLETPNGSIVDHRTDSMKFGIAFIIAFGSQLGLLLLTFKVDRQWKQDIAGGKQQKGGARGYVAAAIEVVQHVDLVTAWGTLSFVIDTVGDYVFVSNILAGIGTVPQIFLTALYAIFLYALSTIAFSASIQLFWAALAASAKYAAQHRPHHSH
jgi:hypothetical protein